MQISERCYAITGLYFTPPWALNSGFIIGHNITMIIDTGGCVSSARTILGYAKAAKPGNKIIVVNTEKHLDHIGGNCLFYDNGIDIYGHKEINRNQKEFDEMMLEENQKMTEAERKKHQEETIPFKGSRIVNPNIKIENDQEIELGGNKIEIFITPGHTDTNISVYVPEDKVIFTGDCIVNGYYPNISEGNINKWNRSLDRIMSLDPEIIVPGHGDVIFGSTEVGKIIESVRTFINGRN
jgi:glyoxylase-like metal-dependent hydrolase (beta-lactamase superfamily II)